MEVFKWVDSVPDDAGCQRRALWKATADSMSVPFIGKVIFGQAWPRPYRGAMPGESRRAQFSSAPPREAYGCAIITSGREQSGGG